VSVGGKKYVIAYTYYWKQTRLSFVKGVAKWTAVAGQQDCRCFWPLFIRQTLKQTSFDSDDVTNRCVEELTTCQPALDASCPGYMEARFALLFLVSSRELNITCQSRQLPTESVYVSLSLSPSLYGTVYLTTVSLFFTDIRRRLNRLLMLWILCQVNTVLHIKWKFPVNSL